MNLLVIGAGAWGTALAIHAARLGAVGQAVLWARDADQARDLARQRCNDRYLPGVSFPDALQVGLPEQLEGQLGKADLILLATPSSALPDWMTRLQSQSVQGAVAWLSKGFIRLGAGQESLLAHEMAARLAPSLRCGVLSGPSFAQEVAAGLPTAVVAASAHEDVTHALVSAFHGDSLRVYANDDLVGVEVGGAVKNVLAIATGLCDGLSFGLNARAALITRGLAEMTRLGLALGARVETFMGLSGLGDLVLTATGDLSRNRQVGLQLAGGKTLDEALQSLGHVAEGVRSARIVQARAQALGVDMPITAAVVALLDGQMTPRQAVSALMGRQARREVA
jgi:glycerol-3-phosphate dehydrogenase (NAD(P)+)